jgi:predicted transglutaminase-like cysteine proteinase
MFSPHSDGLVDGFQPTQHPHQRFPSVFNLAPPAEIPAGPVGLSSLPQYPEPLRFNFEAPALEPAKPEAEVALPAPQLTPREAVASPPVAAIPLPTPREAIVNPDVPAVQAKPRDIAPRHRASRPAPRTDLIAFDGPAGAPFAHTRFCLKYPAECRVSKQKLKFRGGAIELTAERRQELKRINAEVNRSIVGTAMNEPVAQEQWLIGPTVGDCNDYAVTKRHKLLARGWPARAQLLAEVVTTWGEHHLVLVVRTRQGDLVADNLNANLHNWARTPYQWVRIESPVNPLYWAKLKAPEPDVMAMNGNRRRL